MLEKFGEAALREAPVEAMEAALLVLEAKAVELAPVDEGNLEAATATATTVRPPQVVGELAFSTPYAAAQHEGIDHRTGDAFQPGPKTQAKPGNEFGPAGEKYLERALRGVAKQLFSDQVVTSLRKFWRSQT